ncbi:MAG: recombinase RecT [Prevotella pallens]|uniref:RecT family recombinase n=1 Tax=Prevotella pallens TaxID=60133 RepID=UPI001CAAEA73|nr:RecT family recombinase [Prevotella pallens]MBF1519434.1 recombinase RecT [Prevotella pallens]
MTQQQTAAPVATQQNAAPVQLPSQNNKALKEMQDTTVNAVMKQVEELQQTGGLVLPKDYNVGNALKSAWIYLQTIETRTKQKAIDVCTKLSICNCLLEMVIRGQHPKKHCYFIACGNSLEYWERYTGKLLRAKRDTNIQEVVAQVIYEGDNFVYGVDKNGYYQLIKHETAIENINPDKIKAAYAVVIYKDGNKHLEVMTMDQIRKSWQQGAARGTSGAHQNFTDQMCKKTVIARACKIELDSATDGEEEELSMTPPSSAEAIRDAAQQQITVQANETPQLENKKQETIDFSESESAIYEPVTDTPQPENKSERKCPI